ncbi:Uncharacterised protein [Acinetobacter baumannii]|nr:Uncharacterised protein [Acinetobacter baumannii]
MCTLVGIYDFKIDQMACHTKLVTNAVSTHHVTCHAGNIKRLSTVVTLN